MHKGSATWKKTHGCFSVSCAVTEQTGIAIREVQSSKII